MMSLKLSPRISFELLGKVIGTLGARQRCYLTKKWRQSPGDGSLADLAAELLSSKGEASGRALSSTLLDVYEKCTSDGHLQFFEYLADKLGYDEEKLARGMRTYLANPGPDTLDELISVLEPKRQELLRRLNFAPNGTARLLRMREDLIRFTKEIRTLRAVDVDFRHIFSSWFNQGFLELRRIDWDTPAAILEKIIRYEAVHSINDWNELRRRTDPGDRRLYAFFHPAILDDPLIFVEVALSCEIPEAIAPILAAERDVIDPVMATTAVFYSISNCQAGLRGVSFGSFLIKQVAAELKREFRNIETFVTLSPIPGFGAWISKLGNKPLIALVERHTAVIAESLAAGDDGSNLSLAKSELMPLVAHYLSTAKTSDGMPVDPVAKFHLGNGARLLRLNWTADISEQAINKSAGIMVNYHYDLPNIERNHEAFSNYGQVDLAPAVSKLLDANASTLALVRDPKLRLLPLTTDRAEHEERKSRWIFKKKGGPRDV